MTSLALTLLLTAESTTRRLPAYVLWAIQPQQERQENSHEVEVVGGRICS
jgi:hypothetical protein